MKLLLILFTVMIAVVFFGELATMYLLPRVLPEASGEWTSALFDATLLSLLLAAVLLPLMLHYRTRNLREMRRALRLQYTLDAHAIVSITDVAGRITYANDRFCEISGYTRQELMGNNHRVLKSGQHAPEIYRDMWRTIAGGGIWQGDICNRNKVGGLYWVHATIAPFQNKSGKPEEYIAIRTEITAQKELEEASRQREIWLRTVLDNLGEAVYTLDTRGNLTYLNAEAERLLGWRLQELSSKSVHDVVHHHRQDGRPLPAEECPIRLAMRESRHYRSNDELFFHKDGTSLPVKFTGAPLLLDGESQGSVAVFSDVREERLLQQRLIEAKDAAEAAARLKAEFLSAMSHEIRTPLNGVIGMTDLLLDTPLDNEQTEFVRIAKLSADALLNIIDDILDFSKIEAGRLTLERTDFSLRQMIENSLDLLATKAREKQLTLASAIAPELPDHLIGDPTRIRQILLNFLSNAIKFTESGEVVLSASGAVVDQDRVLIRLAVRDSGIGLSDAGKTRLFQPFSQVDSSTTRKYGGTGLGLSICRRLAVAMGGEIGVDSAPGEGSTFWVQIPLAAGTGKIANPPADAQLRARTALPGETCDERHDADDRNQPVPSPANRRLLLAEDNPVNQRVAVYMLNKLGYAVDVVENGALAVAAVAGGGYDLVLMDCQMPEMDGFAATGAIRRAEADSHRRVPVIAMTANALQGDREQCLAAGMDDYITKPIDAARLAAVLRSSLPVRAPAKEAVAQAAVPPVAPAAAGAVAIDMHRLTDLFGNDDAVIDEILAVFQQSLQPLRERIKREIRDRGTALKSHAHELRGAAINVGAMVLADLASQLEGLAATGAWAEIETLADCIDKEITSASEFISQRTAQRKRSFNGTSIEA